MASPAPGDGQARQLPRAVRHRPGDDGRTAARRRRAAECPRADGDGRPEGRPAARPQADDGQPERRPAERPRVDGVDRRAARPPRAAGRARPPVRRPELCGAAGRGEGRRPRAAASPSSPSTASAGPAARPDGVAGSAERQRPGHAAVRPEASRPVRRDGAVRRRGEGSPRVRAGVLPRDAAARRRADVVVRQAACLPASRGGEVLRLRARVACAVRRERRYPPRGPARPGCRGCAADGGHPDCRGRGGRS